MSSSQKEEWFKRIDELIPSVPIKKGENIYEHSSEGPEDMPAHIKASLMQTHLSIPVVEGKIGLGTWQGIFLFEHRNSAHSRRVRIHLIGE